jgi:phosphate:Na+ symporter
VANALLFIGFTAQIARFTEWLLPDHPEGEEDEGARHLDPDLLKVPVIALDAARREVVHLSRRTRDLVAGACPAVISGSHLDLKRLRDADRPIDLLHRAIVAFLRDVSEETLPGAEAARLVHLLAIANDLEHIGDIVATGLVTSAEKRMNDDVVISPETARILQGLHKYCLVALDGAIRALEEENDGAAREVREMKATFAERRAAIATHQLTRLRADDPRRLRTYARESELAELFDDIFRIVRRVARSEIALLDHAADGPSEEAVPGRTEPEDAPPPEMVPVDAGEAR